jgi:hypothetical protein
MSKGVGSGSGEASTSFKYAIMLSQYIAAVPSRFISSIVARICAAKRWTLVF